MSLETTDYADGTSVTIWRLPSSGVDYVKARVMCSDGRVRPTVRISATADTFSSVPCAVRVKGMTVSGFMTIENRSGLTVVTDADPRVAKFVANVYGRNADMLPAGAWTSGERA